MRRFLWCRPDDTSLKQIDGLPVLHPLSSGGRTPRVTGSSGSLGAQCATAATTSDVTGLSRLQESQCDIYDVVT